MRFPTIPHIMLISLLLTLQTARCANAPEVHHGKMYTHAQWQNKIYNQCIARLIVAAAATKNPYFITWVDFCPGEATGRSCFPCDDENQVDKP